MKPRRRVHGILLLDKALGESSNFALQRVKYLFQAEKAGHTGSLDPLATGVLPICFGEATKYSQFLLDADKHYYVEACLGATTNTGDAEGTIQQQRAVPEINVDFLENIFSSFRGDIAQLPCLFSAVKINGKPMYRLARKGVEVERTPRNIHISKLELKNFDQETLSLEVMCSKGTYIRQLIIDIGEQIGCGAYVKTLRRLSVGAFAGLKTYTFKELEGKTLEALDNCLLPIEAGLDHFPEVKLTSEEMKLLMNGLQVPLLSQSEQAFIRIYSENSTFLGLGEITATQHLRARRLLATTA